MNAVPRRSSPLTGRAVAAQAVVSALTGRQFVSAALRAARAAGQIDGREAALAMEIAQGTVRHALTLEHVLSRVARYRHDRTPPQLRAVLYSAAYQIIWMDRIPIFAAVDEAVALARQHANTRAAGMVNAVLRKLTAAIAARRVPWEGLNPHHVRVDWRQACEFALPVLPTAKPDHSAEHLAGATGERTARYELLVARHGPDQAEAIAWASQALPTIVLQRNPRRATPTAFETAVRLIAPEAELAGDSAFVPAATPVIDSPPFLDGLLYVQDSTAHAATAALAATPGERILDLCAAPGGKSVALALAMNDQGKLVACDVDAQRLRRVTANAARLGLSCIATRELPAVRGDLPQPSPLFDAALVDVPCSNSGVLARRPEARLGLTERKLGSLVSEQQTLLRRAARCVRPGGRVVYSTCSIESEENGGVVRAFLTSEADWRLDHETTIHPAWGPRLADWRDGGYFARLTRTAPRP